MVNSPSDLPQLASDAIFCNPSDIATWVDSLLSEFNHQPLMSLPSGPESKATATEEQSTKMKKQKHKSFWTWLATSVLFKGFRHQIPSEFFFVPSALQDDAVRVVYSSHNCHCNYRWSLICSEDPTLPKPWRRLVDGKIGDLYFWNPETKVTQYDRPTGSVAPSKPYSAQSISSSVHIHQSSQGQRRPDEGNDRYGRGINGGSKFDTGSRNQQVSKLATWVISYTVATPCNLLSKYFLMGTDTWGRASLLNLPCPLPQEVVPVTERERHFHPQSVFLSTLSASFASEAHQGRTSSSKSSADADGDTKKSKR
ncbi:hypothetical protein ACFX12_014759 [Malus domestica]